MRYLTVTGYPDNVEDNSSMLRQVHCNPLRWTELFIVMTMHNEDDTLFARTMHGVMRSIAYLCKCDRSKTWGKDGWKKVVVCIVSDGRQRINSRTLSAIAAIGAYQEAIATNVVNGKPVSAHIYEYTTQIAVTESNKIEGAEKGIFPVQIVVCLEEKNQKKINSHRWFFNAFGPIRPSGKWGFLNLVWLCKILQNFENFCEIVSQSQNLVDLNKNNAKYTIHVNK
ncbi:chitin synthase-domain-containing protein [Lactarius pseudohatsudake]|nr:chitin synthase-domain-containing protein [Lactarius pseudohatsudake]